MSKPSFEQEIKQKYPELDIKKAIGGIACFDGLKTIYINEKLFDYPALCQDVLNHELEHFYDVQNEKNKLDALKNLLKTEIKDFKNRKKQSELLLFALKHPRAFLPYMIHENQKIIILNQAIGILFTLTIGAIIFWLFGNFIFYN